VVGETQDRPFQLSFNSSLKVDFQGSRVTSDGGLVMVRELDERLGLSALMERHLIDSRRGKNMMSRKVGSWESRAASLTSSLI
jgi:Transposase DDE domain group 1